MDGDRRALRGRLVGGAVRGSPPSAGTPSGRERGPRASLAGRRGAGFTLIEMLVAIALTGLLTTGVYLALDRALGASDRNRVVQEEERRDRNARSVLTALLRGARPEEGLDAFRGLTGDEAPSGADELRFSSALAFPFSGHAPGDPLRVRLWRRGGQRAGIVLELASASSLVRYPTRGAPRTRVLSSEAGARVDTLLLFPAVRSMEAAFRRDDGSWRERWSEDGALPAAIRLEFGREREAMPPLFVAPRSGHRP